MGRHLAIFHIDDGGPDIVLIEGDRPPESGDWTIRWTPDGMFTITEATAQEEA